MQKIWDKLLDILVFILESLGLIEENEKSKTKQTKQTWRSDKYPPQTKTSTEPISTLSPTKETESQTRKTPEYRKHRSVLTPRERVFFRTLMDAAGDRYLIFSKVRLADFIWLKNESQVERYHLNQILCKHIDFLLCTADDCSPIMAIELDDSSHDLPGRSERDQFKDELFDEIGLPLVRIRQQDQYNLDEISALITEELVSSWGIGEDM